MKAVSVKVVRKLFNTLQSSSAGRLFSGGVVKTVNYALKFVGWQAVYEGGAKFSIMIRSLTEVSNKRRERKERMVLYRNSFGICLQVGFTVKRSNLITFEVSVSVR